MGCTDPVQKIVHGRIVESVAHLASDPGRPDPTLLPQDAQGLGHRIFRTAHRDCQLPDTDARNAMQAQQNLQPIGVLQQIETLRPSVDVHIRRRRHNLADLLPGLRHRRNLAQWSIVMRA